MAKNIEMNYYNGSGYEVCYPKTLANLVLMSDEITIETKIGTIDSNISSLNTEMNSVKTSVSNGKASIASAITDKGVSTSNTATFDTMATNIRSIQTGVKWFILIQSEGEAVICYLPSWLIENYHSYIFGILSWGAQGHIVENIRFSDHLGWSSGYNGFSVSSQVTTLNEKSNNELVNWANNYQSYSYSSSSFSYNMSKEKDTYYFLKWHSGSYSGPTLLIGVLE